MKLCYSFLICEMVKNLIVSIDRGEKPLIDFNAFWNCEAKFHMREKSRIWSLLYNCDVTPPCPKVWPQNPTKFSYRNLSPSQDIFLMNLYSPVFYSQAHSYMLDCALEGSRLCQLTMANKHIHGLDGIPVDPEQAYGKFHLFLFLRGKPFA